MGGYTVESFSATTIKELRIRARDLLPSAKDVPNGWSLSPTNPSQIVTLFRSLRLKAGFTLQAYLFKNSGGDGRGIVWALPEDHVLPDPGNRPALIRWLWHPMKPRAALRNCMEAITGDGTPNSYLCASILARELAEFGARWHLLSWTTEDILDKDPWIEPPPQGSFICDFNPDDSWEFHAPRPGPNEWCPRVWVGEDSAIVSFITYSAHIEQRLQRITDRYPIGSYVFSTEAARLATAPSGYIF
jgi:hypothetical protein